MRATFLALSFLHNSREDWCRKCIFLFYETLNLTVHCCSNQQVVSLTKKLNIPSQFFYSGFPKARVRRFWRCSRLDGSRTKQRRSYSAYSSHYSKPTQPSSNALFPSPNCWQARKCGGPWPDPFVQILSRSQRPKSQAETSFGQQ